MSWMIDVLATKNDKQKTHACMPVNGRQASVGLVNYRTTGPAAVYRVSGDGVELVELQERVPEDHRMLSLFEENHRGLTVLLDQATFADIAVLRVRCRGADNKRMKGQMAVCVTTEDGEWVRRLNLSSLKGLFLLVEEDVKEAPGARRIVIKDSTGSLVLEVVSDGRTPFRDLTRIDFVRLD